MKIIPDFTQRLKDTFPDITFLEPYKNARTKLLVRYNNCGHEHMINPSDIMKPKATGSRCKLCTPRSNQKSPKEFEEEVHLVSSTLEVLTPYISAFKPITLKDRLCGHTWDTTANSFLSGHNTKCPYCNNTTKKWTQEEIKAKLEILGYTLGSRYINTITNMDIVGTCGHTFSILPSVFLNANWSKQCPSCSSTTRKVSNEKFTSDVARLYPNITVLEEYNGSATPISIKYKDCGHTNTVRPSDLIYGKHNAICKHCNTPSATEKEVLEFVKSKYLGWVIENDRSILEGQELDIVLPDLGIAIEFNGEYWHSDSKKPKEYHLNKTVRVEDFGYQLLHIMEKDWINNKDIVKSKILSLLGVSTTVYARTLSIKEVSWADAKEFCAYNHIQGAGSPSKVNLGLYTTQGDLVALQTFSHPRFDKTCQWELVRYCSLVGITVVGGASKLLKYFERAYQPASIVTYANRGYSKGALYIKLGFMYSNSTVPNYTYHKGNYSVNRYAAQKHKLKELVPEFYREELTEEQIMKDAGYFRVYDSGNLVFKKTY